MVQRVVSQVEEMSTAEVFPMMRLMFPECRRDVIAAEGWFWFHRAKMAHFVPFKTGCLMSLRADIPDLPAEQAKV